jgi:ribonucleotide monophosphatase NagD (HAD superfamily)
MEKFVNEYLSKVNFVLLLVLVAMVFAIGLDHFMEKRKKADAVVRAVEESKIVVVVLRDGIFYVLEGKEVSIESLSPLIIRHQDNVFRKEGRFYLYAKGNVIYVFDMYNENLIGQRKGGGR